MCYTWDVELSDSVRYAKGVGPKLAQKLNRLGIETISDLIHYYPRRYIDRSNITSISDVKVGEEATVIGVVKKTTKSVTPRQHKRILTVDIFDGTGYVSAVWFNQPYHANRLQPGTEVAFSGKVVFSYQKLQIVNPFYDILRGKDDPVHTSRIVPIHPATSGLTSTMIRRLIKNVLDNAPAIPDALPEDTIRNRRFLPLKKVLDQIHFPDDMAAVYKARQRLIFDELFFLELGLGLRKKRLETTEKGIAHEIESDLVDEFLSNLPFEMTESQKKVLKEIQKDMTRPSPMHRLLLGEVGSGKTVVAVAALLTAVQGGYQGAIMAPTEVLSEQHNLKLKEMIPVAVKVAILLGSQRAKEKNDVLEAIATGKVDLVIGTHALIQEGTIFNNLGLVVVDEQHRFGVRQRISLRQKGQMPDMLVMTATPIPRTLAHTLYGDLDVSILDELPKGRQKIETIVVDQSHRKDAYELIKQQIKLGHQAYIICPLVDESDKLQVKAATQEAERLKSEVFPEFKIGLIHGQVDSKEKDTVMKDFRDGESNILIATTVIEVGIDIPNVTVMLIEDAERFGLSQLHQLRGRIGRGQHKSFCVLFTDPVTDEARERMQAIENMSDGFDLAEEDLRIRGEGQLFGPRQSGLPDLRIASIVRDAKVLSDARNEAFNLIDKDPDLSLPSHKKMRQEVIDRFAEGADWLFSG